MPSYLHPAWFPDGSRIAFVGATDTNRDIYTMDATDANPATRVETGGNAAHDINPDWQNDSVRPTVKKTSPTGSRVSPKANATGAFSEAMDPATLDGTTLKLVKKGSTEALAARDTHSAATAKATLNPDRNSRSRATYRVTVTAGAEDAAGTALVAKTWSFKVR